MSQPEPKRVNMVDIALRAGRAMHKIDLHGPRGATLCSVFEIEAMALALAVLGVRPVVANQPVPDDFLQPFQHALKEASHDQV